MRSVNGYIHDNKLFSKNYFDIAEGMIVATIIFVALAVFLPTSDLIPHADLIFSAATFLFGIASAYYVANRHDRYTQLRSNLAQESASLISLYDASAVLGQEFSTKVANAIANYMAETYKYQLENFVIGSQNEYDRIVDLAPLIEPQMASQHVGADKFMESLLSLNTIREQIFVLGQDKLTWFDWMSMYTLSFLIFISLFSIGFESHVVRMIAVMLSLTLTLILFIIRDLDNMHRNEKLLIYGTYDRVFDKMKKPRVYLKSDIDNGTITPVTHKQYRTIESISPTPSPADVASLDV